VPPAAPNSFSRSGGIYRGPCPSHFRFVCHVLNCGLFCCLLVRISVILIVPLRLSGDVLFSVPFSSFPLGDCCFLCWFWFCVGYRQSLLGLC